MQANPNGNLMDRPKRGREPGGKHEALLRVQHGKRMQQVWHDERQRNDLGRLAQMQHDWHKMRSL